MRDLSEFNFELVGTERSGWYVDIGKIPEDSTVISIGMGDDISFDHELIRRKSCKIVGIDPTAKAAHYVKNNYHENITFIQKAVHADSSKKVRIYMGHGINESAVRDHNCIKPNQFYDADVITIPELLSSYEGVSVLKMDVEGSEYDIIESLKELSVPQFCVEFHHFCTSKTVDDTKRCISKIQSLGYTNFAIRPSRNKKDEVEKPLIELTFVHDSIV